MPELDGAVIKLLARTGRRDINEGSRNTPKAGLVWLSSSNREAWELRKGGHGPKEERGA